MAQRHFPQICSPVNGTFSVHLSRQASLLKPSPVSADTGQALMHLPHEPSILKRHLSSRQGASCAHWMSVTTEKNLPAHPASVMSIPLTPKFPRPAMRATCLWDQTLYVPSMIVPASSGTAARNPIASTWEAMNLFISAHMALVREYAWDHDPTGRSPAALSPTTSRTNGMK